MPLNVYLFSLLIITQTVANCESLIHLTNKLDGGEARRPMQEATPACVDKVEVKTDLVYLPNYIKNNLHHDTIFFQSESVSKNIQPVLNRHVEGLGTYTVRDVLNLLTSHNCYAYLYGGIVRDMFLNATPYDIDVRVDCTAFQIHTLCTSYYPRNACRTNLISGIVHIGVENTGSRNILDLAPLTKTFLSLNDLEYSANSLALDTNKDRYIVFDLTGYGVRDVCNKHIKIPATRSDWDMWLTENSIIKSKNFMYRFWKLRVKGFKAVSEETNNYVIKNAKNAIVFDNGFGFKNFYCKEIYKAYCFDAKYNACFYKNVTTASCFSSVTIKRKQSYESAIKSDFGYYYWNNELRDMIPLCSISK